MSTDSDVTTHALRVLAEEPEIIPTPLHIRKLRQAAMTFICLPLHRGRISLQSVLATLKRLEDRSVRDA